MRRFGSRADAEREMRAYEARGHKQTYWIEPAEARDVNLRKSSPGR